MKTITPRIRRARPAPAAPPAALPPAVELQIDAVVLHGFSRADGLRAAVALQEELTRLVGAHGLPDVSAARDLAQLDAGTIAAAARPELTGARAARALHRTLPA